MKQVFERIFTTINPNNYSELAEEPLSKTIKHFSMQFGLLMIVLAVLFVPAYILFASTIPETMSSFSNATLDGNFSAQERILLLNKPTIVFDERATDARGAQLVVSENATYYNKYYWFGKTTIQHDDVTNLQTTNKQLLFLAALFLLPAIVFWAGAYVLIKSLLFILVSAILAWAIIGAFKQSITFTKALKVGFYVTLPIIVVELLLFPFWRGFWLWLAIYVVLFIVGVLLLSTRKTRNRRK